MHTFEILIFQLSFNKLQFSLNRFGFWLLAAFGLGVFGVGCQSDGVEPDTQGDVTILGLGEENKDICGEKLTLEMQDETQESRGEAVLFNDEDNFEIQYTLPQGYELVHAKVYLGEIGKMPFIENGTPDLTQFEELNVVKDGKWVFRKPVQQMAACASLAFNIQLKGIADGGIITLWPKGKAMGKGTALEWCLQKCSNAGTPCAGAKQAGQFRTFTLDQWMKVTEARAMLDQQFSAVFPAGLETGCKDKWQFATAEELEHAYPMDGEPQFLDGRVENPARRNKLMAEVIALNLNLAFDKADEKFSASPVQLSQLKIAEGPFSGWTVADIQLEANQAVGNCTSNYSPNQLYEVLHGVNANFAEGKAAKGFLVCPE